MNNFLKKIWQELVELHRIAHQYLVVEGHFGCALTAYSIDTAVKKLDLSEELAEIIRTDNTALLSRVGAAGLIATQLKHSWPEDKLNPNTATESGVGINTTATTFSVATGQGARFKVGTIFKDNTAGKSEIMRVDAISSDEFTTVKRGLGAGFTADTGETHAASFPILIISHNKDESWIPTQEDWSQERSGVYNYRTTMGLGIAISRIRQAVSHAAIPSEFAHQAAYRLKEFMRQLDSIVINSVRSAYESGDSSAAAGKASAMGLIDAVRYGMGSTAVSTGNRTTTSEALTPSVLNALVKLIWDDGGMVAGGRLACIVGGVQKRKISAFDQAYRRMDFDSKTAGYVVERFLSDLGFEVEIIVDPHMPDDTIVVGDLNRLRVGPVGTDAVALEDLAKRGRMIEAMLSGTYTLEVRNALEAWAIHTSLTS